MAKAWGIRRQRNDDDAAPFRLMSSARIMRPRPSAVILRTLHGRKTVAVYVRARDAYRRV